MASSFKGNNFPRLGALQLRIMRLLWKQKQLNARQITDALNSQEDQSFVTHSTVQTILRKLEDKGAISHKREERTFIYFSCVEEESSILKTTRDFLERVFAGSTAGLVTHLLNHEKIPAAELKEIKRLIQSKEKK